MPYFEIQARINQLSNIIMECFESNTAYSALRWLKAHDERAELLQTLNN